MPNSPNNANDAEVIKKIISGDVNAFEFILDKYRNYIFTIVGRHVPKGCIEDTVQDVFIRVYRALPGFDNRSSFKHWMTSIAIRACYDLLRRKYRSREVSFSSLTGPDKDSVDTILSEQSKKDYFADLDLAETRKLLQSAIDRLTPENRLLIELIYFEGCSVKEAADLLGWSVANVKIRSFRSRKQLNAILKQLMKV